jgi:hypothetical protein
MAVSTRLVVGVRAIAKRHDARTERRAWSQHAMVAQKRLARWWNQGGDARHRFHGLHDSMGREPVLGFVIPSCCARMV